MKFFIKPDGDKYTIYGKVLFFKEKPVYRVIYSNSNPQLTIASFNHVYSAVCYIRNHFKVNKCTYVDEINFNHD